MSTQITKLNADDAKDFREAMEAERLNRTAGRFGFVIIHCSRKMYTGDHHNRFKISTTDDGLPEAYVKGLAELYAFMEGVKLQARIMRAKLFPGLE